MRESLEDYEQRRSFDRDRTHVENVLRVAREIRRQHVAHIASQEGIPWERDQNTAELGYWALVELYRQLEERLHDAQLNRRSDVERLQNQVDKLEPIVAAAETSREEDPRRVANVEGLWELVYLLREADSYFVDDVEELLRAAVAAVREIDDAERLADARAAQERFRASMDRDIERTKETLKRMNGLAGDLIDLL